MIKRHSLPKLKKQMLAIDFLVRVLMRDPLRFLQRLLRLYGEFIRLHFLPGLSAKLQALVGLQGGF